MLIYKSKGHFNFLNAYNIPIYHIIFKSKVQYLICTNLIIERCVFYTKMISINEYEVKEIRKRFPHVHIARTCKQKSHRHRYYVEERDCVINVLNSMRKGEN